jgi:tetratricopeptide (TPR) repeat protein
MPSDERGLETTAASQEAVTCYDATMAEYLGFGQQTGPRLKETLMADPNMVMGHCLKGYFFHLMGDAALVPRAGKSLAAAEAGAAAATPRERRHVAALEAWCAGDRFKAVDIWEEILIDHPHDVLAIKLAHFHHFYLGHSRELRDSAARVLPVWSESTPGYGYLLGLYAFGLEESGDFATAEETGRQAVEINPSDIWAVHAVAHVMEMQGRSRDGIAWLTETAPHWRDCNNFSNHVWWHLALFHLGLEEHDAVLALLDEHVRAEDSEDYLDIANATALLQRLELAGIQVGDRWRSLAERCARRVDDRLLAFADAHFALALAAGGKADSARAMVASMKQSRGGPTETPIYEDVGRPLCEAMLAYRRGENGRAVELLLPIRYRIWRIGGSHAQRDLFDQVLIAATIADGRLNQARALLAERLATPSAAARNWRDYADVLDALGEGEAAAAARQNAGGVLAA